MYLAPERSGQSCGSCRQCWTHYLWPNLQPNQALLLPISHISLWWSPSRKCWHSSWTVDCFLVAHPHGSSAEARGLSVKSAHWGTEFQGATFWCAHCPSSSFRRQRCFVSCFLVRLSIGSNGLAYAWSCSCSELSSILWCFRAYFSCWSWGLWFTS